MRGGISKVFIAPALAALLTLGLVACGADEETTTNSNGGAAAADFEPAPLQVSGDEPELREAAEAVHAFYTARARGEWDTTCSQIAAALLEKLEGLAAQTEAKGCPEFLESFTTSMSDAAWREVTLMDAESLRSESGGATLIYRGAGGETYSMPLSEEGGEWKVEALQAPASG